MTLFFVRKSASLLTLLATLALLVLPNQKASAATLPELVKDINTTVPHPLEPANSCQLGSVLLFSGRDATHGTELWRTDGTTAGTYMVKDIMPSGDSSPSSLTLWNGLVYFFAQDAVGGLRLWRTDGTEIGTQPVHDPLTTTPLYSPLDITMVGSLLYFRDTGTRHSLWCSDGTSAGTFRLVSLPVIYGGESMKMTAVGSTLYFLVTMNSRPNEAHELWKSNGTVAGTVPVRIFSGLSSTAGGLSYLTAFGDKLYFSARTDDDGAELWSSDGTIQGTVMVKDIFTGSFSSSPRYLVVFNGALYFQANNGGMGSALWKSDGTTAGTAIFKNNGSTSTANLRVLGGAMYFTATVFPSAGVELYRSDGTSAGTALVKDIYPGAGSASPALLTAIGSTVYFRATDGTNGIELWKTDGTSANTVMVKDLRPGSGSSTPDNLTAVGSTLYFSTTDEKNGRDLWKSDGTDAGTTTVNSGANGGSGIGKPVVIGGTAYYAADDGIHGSELWKSDGTAEGTLLVRDIVAGAAGSTPAELTAMAGTLYFRATTSSGSELWKSDGTEAGTVMVKDISVGTGSGYPSSLAAMNGVLYFSATDSTNGTELWKSDGTEAGTVMVKDIMVSGVGSSYPTLLTPMGNTLYFVATDPSNQNQNEALWKSDGTTAGTVMVKSAFQQIHPGIDAMVAHAGTLYFSGADNTYGARLWKSDGTAAGTVPVQGTSANGVTGGFITLSGPDFCVVGQTLYFEGRDSVDFSTLWRTDGTVAGTYAVRPRTTDTFLNYAENLTSVGGTLYFSAWGSSIGNSSGFELWKSDGTAAGTVLVRDIIVGSAHSYPTNLTAVGNALYFTVNDGVHGMELWRSDGTPAGTAMVTDLTGDSGSSTPANLTVLGSRLLFTAATEATGSELWALDISTPNATALFTTWATSAGLTGNNATLTAIPFGDGVPNLVKYAFGLSAAGPDSHIQPTGPGASLGGLPAIGHGTATGSPAVPVLRFEFVRRIGSGLSYTPQKSATLGASSWSSLTSAPTITPINAEWERVVYEEPYTPATEPRLFGRVLVTLP